MEIINPTIKNIALVPFYKIETYVCPDNNFDYLKAISRLSLLSMKKNLVGVDEIRVIGNRTVRDVHEMEYDIIKNVMGVWATEPCNVLLIESDTLCVKPVDLFGKSDKMMMYALINAEKNEADFARREEEHPFKDIGVRYHMNSGVITFPHSMPMKTWEAMREGAHRWERRWAYYQYIWNLMFYSQFSSLEEGRAEVEKTPFSKYNWFKESGTMFLPKEDAAICHYFLSRGFGQVLDRMRSDAMEAGILSNA